LSPQEPGRGAPGSSGLISHGATSRRRLAQGYAISSPAFLGVTNVTGVALSG